ncbi:reduced folate transporter isoform X3 [Mus musculus]|uniref:reduced folate transporter isoform e n=1 Tax=Mus musculus TaxID=10090 RepID=UPI00167BD673|nr:reduced folate transporter isoform X3 [Mus musculus]
MVPTGQVAEKQAYEEPRQDHELKSWRCLVFYLCFFGFMAQLRPGESFITPFLLERKFTKEQVTNEIIPMLPYSHLAVLVPVFLLTDYLRYKPVLVLQCLSFVCVWLLLLLGTSVVHMQLMEVFYSVTMAARIAYSSYIFSLVHPSRYQRMASYSRAAVLLGVFISSVLGQALVTVGHISTYTLNCVSLGFILFSLVLSLFLKRPKRSLFFNRSTLARGALPCELDQMHPGPDRPETRKLDRMLGTCRDSFLVRMLSELVENARQPQLRLWCLWRHHVLLRRLPEHPLDSVVQAGHRRCDRHPGQPGFLYVPDPGHLGVLRDLCAFPWGLPVPCAHCHTKLTWHLLPPVL